MLKNSPANAGDTDLIPGLGRSPGEGHGNQDPLEKDMATTPVFLPGKSHGERSLTGYNPWGRKRVRHNLAIKEQNTYVIIINICQLDRPSLSIIQSLSVCFQLDNKNENSIHRL